jgi:Uma2 family endonuclease
MAKTPTAVRWTVADLELFPEDSQRYEIVDGELFVSRAAGNQHQRVCTQCVFGLEQWNHQTRLGVVLVAPGVIFSDADAVIPDVVWVSRERLAAVQGEDDHLHGAPELVLEVLSSGDTNERRDREAKLRLYSVWGVREYWIVDWRTETVAVYRRRQARGRQAAPSLRLEGTLGREDTLTSPLLPGFALAVAQLFERDT